MILARFLTPKMWWSVFLRKICKIANFNFKVIWLLVTKMFGWTECIYIRKCPCSLQKEVFGDTFTVLGNSYIQQPNCLRTLWLLLCWLNTCIHDPMTQPIFYHRMVSWDGENPLLKWSNQFMLVKYQFMLADKFLFFTGTVIAFLTVAYLWW